MDFLRKFIVLFLLIHVVTSTVLHRPLVLLCKYSGKDNYFWAKCAFWTGAALCMVTISGVIFLLVAYVVVPNMILGKSFFLPSVANKFRQSEGESVPIEMALVLPLAFAHVFNIGFLLFLMPIGDVAILDFARLVGYILSYTSVCFLVDRQSGGKSLFKRASERLKRFAQKTREKLGSDDVLPQPI